MPFLEESGGGHSHLIDMTKEEAEEEEANAGAGP